MILVRQMTTIPSGANRWPSLSVVVPVYRSEAILPDLVQRLSQVLPSLAEQFELVFVNDCSPDRSWDVISDLAGKYPWIHPINLMRNYGQHNALLCGIRAARYDVIVTMDDDLQHPPEEIPKLLQVLAGGYDVVYGTPEREQHGLGRDFASWGTNRFAATPVSHRPRQQGTSGYTFRKLMTHAMNMMTGFSTMPLQMASLIGFVFTLFGVFVLAYVVVRYFVHGNPVPGFPFLASIVALFSGAQLFALGIIGEYLARMHFRSMQKPPYVVRLQVMKNDADSGTAGALQ